MNKKAIIEDCVKFETETKKRLDDVDVVFKNCSTDFKNELKAQAKMFLEQSEYIRSTFNENEE